MPQAIPTKFPAVPKKKTVSRGVRKRKSVRKDEVPHLDGVPLTAIPDKVDFRDQLYVPSLVEVPVVRTLEQYQEKGTKVLHQGAEGACTGFGLAAVANYLLSNREVYPDETPVSPRMMYEMAKRHDIFPGRFYQGSTARGAMKGWHKYGVCSEEQWPYTPGSKDRDVSSDRIEDAVKRPLGAYFRVNHKDLVAMHSALAEVGILYVTAIVHDGWSKIRRDGRIPFSKKFRGGHAFAIVGYDEKGFWFQNSWGEHWGNSGFGHLTYEDWMRNGKDVWVARLGAPIDLSKGLTDVAAQSTMVHFGGLMSYRDMRPHIINLGNDGLIEENGDFGNTKGEIQEIFRRSIPDVTKGWGKKRILLFAHGGLVSAKDIVQRFSKYKDIMLTNEVYPLCFVWHSDFWSTLQNLIKDALRNGGDQSFVDELGEFMWDRIDETIEPIARSIGKPQWDEMKENAERASFAKGGAKLVADELFQLMQDENYEIHLVGHSAGSILLGPFARRVSQFAKISTCTLWAPACTIDFFLKYYEPLLHGAQARKLRELALYVLSDRAERDDHCANLYHKSLLYLVSGAFEDEFRIFDPSWKGAPILGMEKFINSNSELKRIFKKTYADLVVAPNTEGDVLRASKANSHGGFSKDADTLKGLLARILHDDELMQDDVDAEFINIDMSQGKRLVAGQITQLS